MASVAPSELVRERTSARGCHRAGVDVVVHDHVVGLDCAAHAHRDRARDRCRRPEPGSSSGLTTVTTRSSATSASGASRRPPTTSASTAYPVAVLVAADAEPRGMRERVARRAQLLTGGAECGERDVVERGAREQELAEQPEHRSAPPTTRRRRGSRASRSARARRRRRPRAVSASRAPCARRCRARRGRWRWLQPRGIPSTRSARICRWIS